MQGPGAKFSQRAPRAAGKSLRALGPGAQRRPWPCAQRTAGHNRRARRQKGCRVGPAGVGLKLRVYYGSFHAVADVSTVRSAPQCDRVHRPVRVRQVDGAALAQPHARGHPRRPRRGRGAARRRGHLRRRGRPGRRPHDHRHGVPAAEPVPHHVDSRQRGGRPEAAGRAQQEGARRGRRALAAGAPTCGTRSRTGSTSPAAGCPAVSSSGCASPGRSRSSPTCC